MPFDTAHFHYVEHSGCVELRCLDDNVNLGPLESADTDCPSMLREELDGLRLEVLDAEEFGRACTRTAAAADRWRHSPEGWR